MIRFCDKKDIELLNPLLKELNYELNSDNFNNEFLKVVVYEEDKILGTLVYTYIYDRIEIEYIVVDKNNRRKKIATKLLKFIEENYNIKNITLEVRRSNKVAISFYKRNGFSVASIRKNYYPNEDGLLMIKKFGD